MPRTARASVGNIVYHVLNRGNAQGTVFHKDEDYGAFLKLLHEANERANMRLLSFCLMPNHFHLVAWPRKDGDLSQWMQWLMTAHVRRHHRDYNSSGHVWQGRFKAFPVQPDDHLLTLMRYVERNPVRAKTIPVRKAQAWPWSSAGTAPAEYQRVRLHSGPVKRPTKWLNWVNSALTPAELLDIRSCIARGSPLGSTRWRARTATRLGIESSIRPRGRPKKSAAIK